MTFTQWKKSSYSNSATACVELGYPMGCPSSPVAVRDSKNPDGPALQLADALPTFLRLAKSGHFDQH